MANFIKNEKTTTSMQEIPVEDGLEELACWNPTAVLRHSVRHELVKERFNQGREMPGLCFLNQFLWGRK